MCRESPNFEVLQAHPRTKLSKYPPVFSISILFVSTSWQQWQISMQSSADWPTPFEIHKPPVEDFGKKSVLQGGVNFQMDLSYV